MPRPKRTLHATAAETTSPPTTLPPTHTIARIVQAAGNNLYLVHLPSTQLVLLENDTANGSKIDSHVLSNQRSRVEMEIASATTTLVEMPTRFRSVIWVKRGSFVVVDLTALLVGVAEEEREGQKKKKVGGEIINVVREEKRWRAMEYWPREFGVPVALSAGESDSDEEESVMGKMPP